MLVSALGSASKHIAVLIPSKKEKEELDDITTELELADDDDIIP